jgi:hypothetical protein
MQIDAVSQVEAEKIAYKTTFLIFTGWRREYVDYSEQKLFDHEYDYLWCKPEAVHNVYYDGDRIETKYFTLDQAFDFAGQE